MASSDEKIMTQNVGGKKGVSISKSKYVTIRSAIITVLSNKQHATIAELQNELEKNLHNKFEGRIGWYLMAVKLDLEVQGIIERVPGKTPQQLALKKSI